MRNTLLFIIFLFFVSSCTGNETCNNQRSFDSWDFQQTWFKSNHRSVENQGAIFGDNSGDIYHPVQSRDFKYCAQDMTLHISYNWPPNLFGWSLFKKHLKIKILEINKETMTLLFPDGTSYKYYRAE